MSPKLVPLPEGVSFEVTLLRKLPRIIFSDDFTCDLDGLDPARMCAEIRLQSLEGREHDPDESVTDTLPKLRIIVSVTRNCEVDHCLLASHILAEIRRQHWGLGHAKGN